MRSVRLLPVVPYAAAFVLAVVVGRATVLGETGLALFWPAAGVAALWVQRGRQRSEVALDLVLVFLTTVVTNVVLRIDLVPTLLFAAGNVAVGVTWRALQARAEHVSFTEAPPARLSSSRDLFVLFLGSFLAGIASAPLGTTAGWLSSGHWSWAAALSWVVRNACGVFVVAGPLLAVLSGGWRDDRPWGERLAGTPRRFVVAELSLATACLLGVISVSFFSGRHLPLAFLPIAGMAWVGFRFTPVVSAVESAALGVLTVVAAQLGSGPFDLIESRLIQSVVAQTFILTAAVIGLMLSVGVAERLALLERVRSSEDEARSRAALLDAVTEVIFDGIAVVDAEGGIVLSNSAAVALSAPLVDQRRVEEPGAHGLFWPDGSAVPAEQMPHVRALSGQSVPPTDLLRIDPSTGEQLVLSFSAAPLNRPGGPPLAVLHIHDATRERAQTRELEGFAGVVAHDLKNPLLSVMTWAEILDEQLDDLEEDASPARTSLVSIYRSADRMQQLIDDLLELSRTSNAELEPISLSLDQLLDEVVEELLQQGPSPTPHVEHADLGFVHADHTLVRQLLDNLVGNAVKYVASGTQPRIVVAAQLVSGMVEVQVSDNGIGIPPADRGKVFDSFYRGSATGAYPGTGLGLSICARTVERHGGRISARSGPDGRGTTIVFTLPVDPAHPWPARPGSDQREGRTTSAEPPPRRTGSETAVS